MLTAGSGHVDVAFLAERADHEVVDSGHEMRELPGTDLAGVLAESDVTNIVFTVFHLPVPTGVVIETSRSGQARLRYVREFTAGLRRCEAECEFWIT
ncbi:hypothetical protein [Streptosporangium sp. NPDC004631]